VENIEDAVGPFGFEVLNDSYYLERSPHRFFVYIQLPKGAPQNRVEADVRAWLETHQYMVFEALGGNPQWLITKNAATQFKTTPWSNQCIYLNFIQKACDSSLLQRYAEFYSLVPVAIKKGILNEYLYYNERPSCRRFILQAMRVMPTLYPAVDTPSDFPTLVLRAISQEDTRTVSGKRTLSYSQNEDRHVFNKIVVPYVSNLCEFLQDQSEARAVSWTDFHTGHAASFVLNPTRLYSATEKLKTSYLSFGLEI
jgi:hypothetical protein